MFIATVQAFDFFLLGTAGQFLLFFILGWILFLIKYLLSNTYCGIEHEYSPRSVSVIVPVFNEPTIEFKMTMSALKESLVGLDSEVFVVLNGGGKNEASLLQIAKDFGFETIIEEVASKRNAIASAAYRVSKEITIILDSDTVVSKSSIWKIARAFTRPEIGGITPRHTVLYRDKNIWRRVSSWLEDIRFSIVLPGLSTLERVNCLPGRLFAIRSSILKKMMFKFTNQYIFGRKVETGDDRVLTQWMLEEGYETLYDNSTAVATSAPDSFSLFVKQRLRWSRSSFREGMLSLKTLFSGSRESVSWYSVADTIMRWWFLEIILVFAFQVLTGNGTAHFFEFSALQYFIFGLIGFLINGTLRQWNHLSKYPEDIVYLPAFLFISLFILTPIELYGNLTFISQGWLTRKR